MLKKLSQVRYQETYQNQLLEAENKLVSGNWCK